MFSMGLNNKGGFVEGRCWSEPGLGFVGGGPQGFGNGVPAAAAPAVVAAAVDPSPMPVTLEPVLV